MVTPIGLLELIGLVCLFAFLLICQALAQDVRIKVHVVDSLVCVPILPKKCFEQLGSELLF